ncbi:MAG: secondary thiamine-phosphate synthase enzyme YjbQ [archaeon]
MEILSFNTTEEEQAVDITPVLRKIVEKSKVVEGTLLVYCPHTTAAVVVNEGTDETFVADLFLALEKFASGKWSHQSNPKAHLKAAMIGNSKLLPISQGKLFLGAWESVFLLEFDGPRERKIFARAARQEV